MTRFAGFSVEDASRIAQAVIESEVYLQSTSEGPKSTVAAPGVVPLSIEIGKADSDVDPGTEFPPATGEVESGQFTIWKPDSSDMDREAQTQDQITAYDWMGGGIKTGETAYLIRVYSEGVGKWYFIRAAGGGAGFEFTVDTAFTVGEQTASVTVTNGWGGAPTSGLETVVNLPNSKGGFVFAGDVGAYGYALKAEDGNYRIFQMECAEAPAQGDWNGG